MQLIICNIKKKVNYLLPVYIENVKSWNINVTWLEIKTLNNQRSIYIEIFDIIMEYKNNRWQIGKKI